MELLFFVEFRFVLTAFVGISVEVEKKNKERCIENSIEQPPIHPLTTAARKMVPVQIQKRNKYQLILRKKVNFINSTLRLI